MKRLISCEYNFDNCCVELKFNDGSMIAIDTITVENEVAVHDATWQGVVEANGTTYQFQSELQLLRWVMEQYPALRPDVPHWR